MDIEHTINKILFFLLQIAALLAVVFVIIALGTLIISFIR